MKWILIAAIGCCVGFLYIKIQKMPITVFYTYNGPQPEIIFRALNKWNPAGIYFKSDPRGILKITHNSQNYFTNPSWGGEYRFFHILLNTRYHLSSESLMNLVTHEAGHFIGLKHNNDKNSLMCHSSCYSVTISSNDIKDAKFKKWQLFLKLLFYRFIEAA